MLRLRAWRCSTCHTALSVLVVAIHNIPLLESVHLLSLNMFTSRQDARSLNAVNVSPRRVLPAQQQNALVALSQQRTSESSHVPNVAALDRRPNKRRTSTSTSSTTDTHVARSHS
jgi:hypothetical protein